MCDRSVNLCFQVQNDSGPAAPPATTGPPAASPGKEIYFFLSACPFSKCGFSQGLSLYLLVLPVPSFAHLLLSEKMWRPVPTTGRAQGSLLWSPVKNKREMLSPQLPMTIKSKQVYTDHI